MILARLPLVSKIWLATAVALTALSAATGWLFQRRATAVTTQSLQQEVNASFQAYESVWRARAEMLGSLAAVLSSMPNVRAAFGTRDLATIRDTAGDVWDTVSKHLRETAFFVVTDPRGKTLASLDDQSPAELPRAWPVVDALRSRFPAQVSGFFLHEGALFQLGLTPVYVDSAGGSALINVLVAGYPVNHPAAQRLKQSTGGSEFLFVADGRIVASTLNDRASAEVVSRLVDAGAQAVSDGVVEYAAMIRPLQSLDGKQLGRLVILRSFEAARQNLADLRASLVLLWLAAIILGLGLTWILARRIVKPLETLDRAASEVSRQNYDIRVQVETGDELGRLARSFNSMCASLVAARQDLIRNERISTIGRLASSIVHDLRNPLAAIYGGAEMMVDTDLTNEQMKRLAANIYRASRRIQQMLNELADVTRGKREAPEVCNLAEVVSAAVDSQNGPAAERGVTITVDVPEGIELSLERNRIERVFLNLIGNALEAMPGGGEIAIRANSVDSGVVVEVADTGPGISEQIRAQLFQPFVTHGKRSGLGLGLALARQAVLDHGGDMWVESQPGRGARFHVRLPLEQPARTAVAS